VRKRLQALRREHQHQLSAAETALKGSEGRAQWLQLRAKQENRAVYPTPQIEDTLRRGKELNREHMEKAHALMEEMSRLAGENGLTLPPVGTEQELRVDCACCGYCGLKNAYRVRDVWVGPECVHHYPPACGKHEGLTVDPRRESS
jgi:hypothetical protein